jgi:hypothetical protein
MRSHILVACDDIRKKSALGVTDPVEPYAELEPKSAGKKSSASVTTARAKTTAMRMNARKPFRGVRLDTSGIRDVLPS